MTTTHFVIKLILRTVNNDINYYLMCNYLVRATDEGHDALKMWPKLNLPIKE